MKPCDIDVVGYLTNTTYELADDCVLFDCPVITLALAAEAPEVLQDVINGAHKLILSLEEEKSLTDKTADNVLLFCNVLRTLKPTKPEGFLDSITYLLNLLPCSKTLNNNTASDLKCQQIQHHVWLLLSATQLLVAARYLPASLDMFCRILDGILEGLLYQAINRVPTVTESATPHTLVSQNRAVFTAPKEFGSCECILEVWKLVVKKVDEVSSSNAVGDLRFWNIFNKHFNAIVGESDNISGLVWVFEEVVKIATGSCSTLPVNWGALQELTKQSCVKTSHLRQVLQSLTNIGQIWSPHIVIIMTLQQHFCRSLLLKSNTMVPILTPQQYITNSEQIVKHDTMTDDTVFQTFLRFYVRSLDRIPEVRKVTLIKRLFQSNKLDHKSLSSMSSEGLQNLGLLVATCLLVTKSETLTTQIDMLFGSHSGDMISNSTSPSVLISLQIGLTLLHADLGLECSMQLEQLAVMLNRLSEDFVRESESKQCQIFGVISRMLENLVCLTCHDRVDSANFLGSWIEMFFDDNDIQRCSKILDFCCVVVKGAQVNDTSVAIINKFVIKQLQKMIRPGNENAAHFEERAATIFASFACVLHNGDSIDETRKESLLQGLLEMVTTHVSCSFSANFVFKLLQQNTADCNKIFSGQEYKIVNVVFNFLCDSHIKNQQCSPDMSNQVSVLLDYLLNRPELADVKIKMSANTAIISNEATHLFLISELHEVYQSKAFSDAQLLKNFVWKMVHGISETMKCVPDATDDGNNRRLYKLVAFMFEKIPDLLYSPTKHDSPIVTMFQTFFLKKDKSTLLRRQMITVLPKVFHGLSKLSYKSNNLFFKDVVKVFDEAYVSVSARDWEAQKQTPFLVTLFSTSFADEPEKSAKSFRMSFINYISEPQSGYCKLPNVPEKLVILLFFLSRLSTNTKDKDIIKYDFEKLYPFMLQVLFICTTLESKSPKHVKPLVSELLQYFFQQTASLELDLSEKTHAFVARNCNAAKGPGYVIQTLHCLSTLGGVRVVAKSLEYLENALKGRSSGEYDKLRNHVLNLL